MSIQYRQGDILLVAIPSVDARLFTELPRDDRDRIVLAAGEATGHAHAVLDGGAVLVEALNDWHLIAETAVTLVHEEHGPITLPAGFYRLVRQREYRPDGWRQIAD